MTTLPKMRTAKGALAELRKLGYSKEEIRQLLDSYMEEMIEDDGTGTI